MLAVYDHKVTAEQAGVRLDTFCSTLNIDEIPSRSSAARYIEAANILVNGQVVPKKYLIRENDEIHFELPPRSGTDAEVVPSFDIELDIRYEDDDLIVLSKQAGLVCHPSRGHYGDTLANALVAHCGENNLAHVQGMDRPGIVHRLDRDTSGLMLAAKTDKAAAMLQKEIGLHTIDRRYFALVHGVIAPDTGMIDAPITRDRADRMRMMVSDDLKARPSVTTFTVLERFDASPSDDGYTLIECKLYTGRTHQIRVHMSYAQHPVVGDPVYGKAANARQKHKDRAIKAERGMQRQFLHSYSLSFEYPTTHKPLSFQDKLPDDIIAFLSELEDNSLGRTEAGTKLFETMEGVR